MDWNVTVEVRVEANSAPDARQKVHVALLASNDVRNIHIDGIPNAAQSSIWRSIVSAPKDGSPIIGYFPPLSEARTVTWDKERECWETIDHDIYEPTVWIPQRP